ncbi:MAG: M20/M25/M40 family metallo-hydrolase [Deltaproteobacteria bacterium]|nr:M20/M25/M40 family metallo-hydrolase [Deltaproteobacteria bacterium]
MTQGNDAVAFAEAYLDRTIAELKEFAKIPGISANPAPCPELARSAAHCAAWMTRIGLENVEVLELPGVHPYVYGEWLHAEGAPTLLLYAHHDVQPPGRPAFWKSPAFEPEERDGRLYGRGVVDDKAGAAIHFAAIEAFLKTGGLPVNVKVVIDGEEEIGSENLGTFLDRYRERLAADVIVLTDTANLSAGLPSITYALRGITVVHLEVKSIDHPLHSGMWGGPVPDPVMAICKMLATLTDADGNVTIDGVGGEIAAMDPVVRDRLAKLPYDEAVFRAEAGILDGVELCRGNGGGPYELMWHRPSLSISALEAAPIKGASNQIVDSARARIGVRTVPDMDGRKVAEALCAHLAKRAPWGVQVSTTIDGAGNWWITDPRGPAFEAAERALAKGFGREPVYIGCGGSIPFVEPFARVLGGVPALLIGLEDPLCNAHSENESLLLTDFHKAIVSAIHLYEELATLPRKG